MELDEQLQKEWEEKCYGVKHIDLMNVRCYVEYISFLEGQYEKMHPTKKRLLYEGLERLVRVIDNPFNEVVGAMAQRTIRYRHFNGELAAAIRQQEGLTQGDMAKLLKSLGERGVTQSLISAFERGRREPDSKGKYMDWLWEHGYKEIGALEGR